MGGSHRLDLHVEELELAGRPRLDQFGRLAGQRRDHVHDLDRVRGLCRDLHALRPCDAIDPRLPGRVARLGCRRSRAGRCIALRENRTCLCSCIRDRFGGGWLRGNPGDGRQRDCHNRDQQQRGEPTGFPHREPPSTWRETAHNHRHAGRKEGGKCERARQSRARVGLRDEEGGQPGTRRATYLHYTARKRAVSMFWAGLRVNALCVRSGFRAILVMQPRLSSRRGAQVVAHFLHVRARKPVSGAVSSRGDPAARTRRVSP